MNAPPRGCPPRFDWNASPAAHRQFAAALEGYERHGGMATASAFAEGLQGHFGSPPGTVERWIVERKIVSLAWECETFVPLFQFDRADASVRTIVSRVIGELRVPFDDWQLALWFAQPNLWLGNAMPVELITCDEYGVLGAARADRFIALG